MKPNSTRRSQSFESIQASSASRWRRKHLAMRGAELAMGFLAATALWAVVILFGGTLASIRDFAGPAATVFAVLTAGWITFRLGQSQISVAKTQADIAERNWRTSNEKIVLDLFDKRLDTRRRPIDNWRGHPKRNRPRRIAFPLRYRLRSSAVFFGDVIQDYLGGSRLHLIDLNLANTMMEARDQICTIGFRDVTITLLP